MSIKCDRCSKETRTTTMSFFSEETICMDCDSLERDHPQYAEAKRVEREEVLKGNYNFPGVGVPADLVVGGISVA